MTLKRLQVISVPVGDQDRAKAFYVDTLGFELLAITLPDLLGRLAAGSRSQGAP